MGSLIGKGAPACTGVEGRAICEAVKAGGEVEALLVADDAFGGYSSFCLSV